MTNKSISAEPSTDCAKFLSLLHPTDRPFEIRSPECPDFKGANKKSTWGGFFSDKRLAAKYAKELDSRGPDGVYVTINSIDSVLLSKKNSNAIGKQESTAGDDSITKIQWLPLDIDPTRFGETGKTHTGIPATDEERGKARQLFEFLQLELGKRGWPEPLQVSSGNGYLLLYRLDDLEAGKQSNRELIESAIWSCFQLGETSGIKGASVDTKTTNPSRIFKVAGTEARKGTPNASRPHRPSGFRIPSGPISPVGLSQIESLIAEFPQPAKADSKQTTTPTERYTNKAIAVALLACQKVTAEWSNDGSGYLIRLCGQCARFGTGEQGAITVVRLMLDSHPDFPTDPTDDDIIRRYRDAIKHRPEGEALEKPKAGKVDPAVIADQIADEREIYKGGVWYRWADGKYSEVHRTEARASVVNRISKLYSQVAKAVIGNVEEHLQAKQIKPGNLQSPSWLESNHPWNANEFLPFKDKIIHLPSFIAGRPYELANTRDFFTTNCLDYEWQSKNPDCPSWYRFLDSIWDEWTHFDCQRLLQQWFGYCLARGRADLQKILFIKGPTRSGKGTIAEILSKLVGEENTVNPTLQSIGGDRGLAPLVDKQLAIFGDVRFGGAKGEQAVVTERLLSISGQDAITIDRKYRDPITARLHCRLMMLSNELPRLTDNSGALAKRFIVLPMAKSFYGSEDTELRYKLESELIGILHWAIAGWKDLQKAGRFTIPKASQEAMADLADLTNPYRVFVDDECELTEGAEVSKGEMYDRYSQWCNSNGVARDSEITFAKNLRSTLSIDDSRTGRRGERIRKWQGIKLKSATEFDCSVN